MYFDHGFDEDSSFDDWDEWSTLKKAWAIAWRLAIFLGFFTLIIYLILQ